MIKRLQILSRVGNTVWGLGSRILAITTHSLSGSVACFRLSITGMGRNEREAGTADKEIPNRDARKNAGTHMALRLEILMILADNRDTVNHCILKSANILDRGFRAKGATAKKEAATEVRPWFTIREVEEEYANTKNWTQIGLEEKKHPNSNKKETRNDNNPYDEGEGKWAWGENEKQFAASTQAPVRKSIYHMTEESIPKRETRKKLSLCRQ